MLICLQVEIGEDGNDEDDDEDEAEAEADEEEGIFRSTGICINLAILL